MREAAETRWTCGDLALGAYRPALGGALGRVPPERAAVYPPFTSVGGSGPPPWPRKTSLLAHVEKHVIARADALGTPYCTL